LEVDPIQQDGWRISNWTQAANGKTVIDVGTLTDVKTDKLTASTGVKLGESLTNTSLSTEADRSSTRTVDIKDATEFNAAVDNQGRAWLDEVAGWRENLARNLAVTTVLTEAPDHLKVITVYSTSKLSTPDPKSPGGTQPAKPEDVQIFVTTQETPLNDKAAICGVAKLSYRVRHIRDDQARATFSESDDPVVFQQGTSQSRFMLAPPPYTATYAVSALDADVAFHAAGKNPATLMFASLAEAEAFVDWLQQAQPPGGKIHNAMVGVPSPDLGLRALTLAELRNLAPTVASPKDHADALAAEARGCPDPLPAGPAAAPQPTP
jgi:hypothetical protein